MPRVLIVEARFYEDIADELVRGAVQHLEAAGVEYDRVTVPGAFEVPAAIAFAHQGSTKGGVAYDGYIALGCVIRGETTHYDYVCGESARGLQNLAVRDNLAIGYGILTVETGEQAWARAGVDSGKNKGKDAAEACLAMVSLRHQFALT
jgi:6,7-dimethyl-8-ribityllumazine synthase